MLQTPLKHIHTVEEYQSLIREHEKAVIVCGRMGPMCLPVYDVMAGLEPRHPDIQFRDMDFDTPVAQQTIRALPEVQRFHGLPFTVYFRNGRVVAAT
jgi:thioredoxin 1